MYKAYLSGSIISNKQIENFCSKFRKDQFEIFLPHTIEETHTAHSNIPIEIFNICLSEMKKADICLLNLDSYGRDSSWECGWFNAQKKPIVGYVSANLTFLQDWMIKGGIQGILVDNEKIVTPILNDPILKKIKSKIHIFEPSKIYGQISLILQ